MSDLEPGPVSQKPPMMPSIKVIAALAKIAGLSQKRSNILLPSKLSCCNSGLPVTAKQEWQDDDEERGYKGRFFESYKVFIQMSI